MLFLEANPNYEIFLIIWVVVIIATLIAELLTQDLTCIWFTGGGVVALILAIAGVDNAYVQISFFVAVSLILLLTLGRWSRKKNTQRTLATNIDAAIGKEIIILKDADYLHHGEGKYAGLIWTVICRGDDKVATGDIAYIKEIQGNKLVVSLKKED